MVQFEEISFSAISDFFRNKFDYHTVIFVAFEDFGGFFDKLLKLGSRYGQICSIEKKCGMISKMLLICFFSINKIVTAQKHQKRLNPILSSFGS